MGAVLQAVFYQKIKDVIAEHIAKAAAAAGFGDYGIEKTRGTVDLSKGFGDISCSIAFRITKDKGMQAQDAAARICSMLGKIDTVEKVTAEGGFVNFHLDRRAFAKAVVGETLAEGGNGNAAGKKDKVIIEYPSVNPNKPWHVGHLRNALLGDCIANLYEYCGYETERSDYIDDLGLQVVESLWGFMNLGGEPDKKFDHWIGEEYVKVNAAMEKQDVKDAVGKLMQLAEQGGTYESTLLRQISERCVKEQYVTAFDYSIYHDCMIWESQIMHENLLGKALELLKEKKVARTETEGEYAGCMVIDLGSIDRLPPELKGLKENIKVLVRSNGAPTYVAKDIAFHMWKLGLLKCDFKFRQFVVQPNGKHVMTTAGEGTEGSFGNAGSAINIIDSGQGYPQMLVKLAFQAMGRDDIAASIRHLAYGKVEVEGATLSGRKGTWIGYTADDILREAAEKAASLITGRLKLSEGERGAVAKSVALAAIRFEFLRISPEKEIVFSWDKALNFEGNSGPYCQYMNARASRLIEDAGIKGNAPKIHDANGITDDDSFALLKLLSLSSVIVDKARSELKPNIVADYIKDLALAFSRFYEKVPILKVGDENIRTDRLALVFAFRETFSQMLLLLGVEPLKKM
jgi:arginyl-tRNA synthetase